MRLANGTNIAPVVPTAETKQGRGPACSTQPGGVCYVNPIVIPYLNLFQAPNGRDFKDGTSEYIASPLQVTTENYFMTRVDHQISDKMRLFVRYSFDGDTNVLPNFGGNAIADEHDVARR